MQLVITPSTSWKWQSSQLLLQSKHTIFFSIQTTKSNIPLTKKKKKAAQIATQNQKNGTKQATLTKILQQYLQSPSEKRQGRASRGTCWWAWDRTRWGRGGPGRPRRLPRPAEARTWWSPILHRRRRPVLLEQRLRLSPAIRSPPSPPSPPDAADRDFLRQRANYMGDKAIVNLCRCSSDKKQTILKKLHHVFPIVFFFISVLILMKIY